MPDDFGGAGNSNAPDDEITIDPFPTPHIPIPQPVAAIADRIRRTWPLGNGRRPTWRGWLLAAIAALVVIGALKLVGVIWTSAPPKWEAALGPGVTVTGPQQVAPGHDSPGEALAGALAALSSKDPGTVCDYLFTDSIARCKTQFRQTPRDKQPYGVSVKVGYVAVHGTRALVGFTGKVCSPGVMPECVTNTDPAAVFSAGDTFAELWQQTISPNSGNTSLYGLEPCAEVGGKWYLGIGPASAS